MQNAVARSLSENGGCVGSKSSDIRKARHGQSLLTRPWSAQEDKIVLELRIIGWGWMAISKRLEGRSWAACRTRFHNHLLKQCEWDDKGKDNFYQSYQRCVDQAKGAMFRFINLSSQI